MKAERHAKILQYLSEKHYLANEELAGKLGVSIVTIRRDIKELSEQNLVQTKHGGVVVTDYLNVGNEPHYETKAFINADAKKAIGRKALECITENDLFILDSGTTNYAFAKQLKMMIKTPITVVTGDLQIARELCSNGNINLVFLGGSIKTNTYNSYGLFSESMLENIKSHKLFFGCDGVDIYQGVYNSSLDEISLKRKMIEVSDSVILMADSTKFVLKAPYFVCDFSRIDKVISDIGITEEQQQLLSEKGIDLGIAVGI
jgi:DeoR family transcriptional regulator of aga operon